MSSWERSDLECLIAAYPDGIDNGDFETVGDLFARGTWNGRVGREEAIKYLHNNMIIYPDGTPRTRHVVGPVALCPQADGVVEAVSSIVLFQQVDDSQDIRPSGVLDYRDEFRSTGDDWHFHHRDVTPVLADFGRHLRSPPPPPTRSPTGADVLAVRRDTNTEIAGEDGPLMTVLNRVRYTDETAPAHQRSIVSNVLQRRKGRDTTLSFDVITFRQTSAGWVKVASVTSLLARLQRLGAAWVIRSASEVPHFSALPTPRAADETSGDGASGDCDDGTQIRSQIREYARQLDIQEVDGIVTLFRHGRLNDLDPIALARRVGNTPSAGAPRVTFHQTGNVAVDVQGEVATSSSTLTRYHCRPGADVIRVLGVDDCQDEFTRSDDGQWQWMTRQINHRFSCPGGAPPHTHVDW